MNTQKSMWNALRSRSKARIGHIIRNNYPRIAAIIEGKMEDKPGRGSLELRILEANDGRYQNRNTLGVEKKYIGDGEKWRKISSNQTSD